MTKLPNVEFRQLVPLLRENGFYENELLRKVRWPEYNLAQVEDARQTLEFIRDSVDKTECPPFHGKVGRPLTNPLVLAKAVLVCEAFGFTERCAEGWISILGPFLGIHEHLDDRTIGEAYDKTEVILILKQVFEDNKKSDGTLSGDGTGLETSRKQNYEDTQESGEYLTSIVDSREIVQAFDTSGKQECKAMHNLIQEVHGKSLRLDAGFNDRKLVEKIAKLGMTPYVFPKSNNNLNGRPAWKSMYLSLFYDPLPWLTNYHLRSHSESFHSSFKTKNNIIRKRRTTSKLTQVTARIIIHNCRRLRYHNSLILKAA